MLQVQVTRGINHIKFLLSLLITYLPYKDTKIYWRKTEASVSLKTNVVFKKILFTCFFREQARKQGGGAVGEGENFQETPC